MKFVKFEGTVEELQAAYLLLVDGEAQQDVKKEPPLQPSAAIIPPVSAAAEIREANGVLTEAVAEALLTRRPLTKTQLAVLKTIFDAGDKGVTTSEMANLIGCEPATIKGSMRSFGKRVAHTNGWPTDLEAFDRVWLGVENRYRLHPAIRAVIKSGRVRV